MTSHWVCVEGIDTELAVTIGDLRSATDLTIRVILGKNERSDHNTRIGVTIVV